MDHYTHSVAPFTRSPILKPTTWRLRQRRGGWVGRGEEQQMPRAWVALGGPTHRASGDGRGCAKHPNAARSEQVPGGEGGAPAAAAREQVRGADADHAVTSAAARVYEQLQRQCASSRRRRPWQLHASTRRFGRRASISSTRHVERLVHGQLATCGARAQVAPHLAPPLTTRNLFGDLFYGECD
uniref:Uncharacterized protein n=2 Tax=Oryza sativa subsp. japonica TaxID=39947 RepID=Q6ZKX2_ORYSJ|nr:hypothetical protein [Oryza sativa Japonica Group]BAD03115.1 hypothetical protein [Oryza sativa Japonica Group]BAD03603.1 hypothetical protein [Oryza sativa Japonica Group]